MIVAFCAALGAAYFLLMPRNNRHPMRTACLSNIKQRALGMILYGSDYDDRFPSAATWMDQELPYTKNPDLACPELPKGEYGYAMLTSMSDKDLKKVDDPAKQVLMFESTLTMANAHSGIETLCRPARHYETNNIGYADGHAKGIKDDKVP